MNDEERAALRRQMRARRAALDEDAQSRAAQEAARRILALPAYREAKVVLAYAAARGELSLAPVIADVLSGGRMLALPRCEGPGRMTARRVRAMGELSPGAFGLPEPGEGSEVILPQDVGLVLVPGIAFDRAGGRIGQGGGYYDRFLPGTRAVRVGVCHDFALIDDVQARAHDARMDAVVTPQETIFAGI